MHTNNNGQRVVEELPVPTLTPEVLASTPDSAPTFPPSPTPSPTPGTTPLPDDTLPGTGRMPGGPVYGLTLDSVDSLNAIVQSLSQFPKTTTSRIVFDRDNDPTYYVDAVNQIRPYSYIMGELLDSAFVKDLTVSSYQARSENYWSQFKNQLDIWEVGNEINGEWLGSTADVVSKVTSTYDYIHGQGGVTALTLYYNAECFQYADHEMFKWTTENIPQRMKNDLDYVLVSFYEDDCNDSKPDWVDVFTRLSKIFPHSRLGFGEVGTKIPQNKIEYIQRYYSMQINLPHYIGGYFWWYGSTDLISLQSPERNAFTQFLH